MPITKGTRQVAENRRARHDYFIEDTYECGIALVGTEVKSVRAGKVNLKDSYAQVKNGEMLQYASLPLCIFLECCLNRLLRCI